MSNLLRKILVVVVLFGSWEIAALLIDIPLLFPRFSEAVQALLSSLTGTKEDNLFVYTRETCKSLLVGFVIGTVIGSMVTVFAVNSKIGEQFLSTVVGAFSPLPAVAVFPISIMIFGISYSSVVFIAAFASFFPVAVSMTQGFREVTLTLRNVGRNMGMSKLGLTCWVLLPSALPSLLTGLRNGFSNAFRALIAVEMVIGAATGAGGLGWAVMAAKQNLEVPMVYASILTIMLVGLLFEACFRIIEMLTVRRWGMLN